MSGKECKCTQGLAGQVPAEGVAPVVISFDIAGTRREDGLKAADVRAEQEALREEKENGGSN